MTNIQKYPEGHFVALYMSIFLPIGIAIGLVFGNIALGLPIGLVIGLVVGYFVEKKYKKEGKIRPLAKDERKKRNISLIAGIVIAIIFSCIILYLFFSG